MHRTIEFVGLYVAKSSMWYGVEDKEQVRSKTEGWNMNESLYEDLELKCENEEILRFSQEFMGHKKFMN